MAGLGRAQRFSRNRTKSRPKSAVAIRRIQGTLGSLAGLGRAQRLPRNRTKSRPKSAVATRRIQGTLGSLAGLGRAQRLPRNRTKSRPKSAVATRRIQGTLGSLAGCRGRAPARARTQEILRGTAIEFLQKLTCVKVRARRLTRERPFPGDKASSRRRQGKGSRNVTHSDPAHRRAVTPKNARSMDDIAAA